MQHVEAAYMVRDLQRCNNNAAAALSMLGFEFLAALGI